MGQIQYTVRHPYAYRYEDEKYINLFFNEGKLRLSSFIEYQNYNDNQLGDSQEGESLIYTQSTNNSLVSSKVRGKIQTGLNSYSFCTSSFLSQALLKTFSRNSVFRIIDPIGFAVEIADVIPDGTKHFLFGNCDYLTKRNIKEALGNFSVDFVPNDPNILAETIFSMPAADHKLSFLKLIEYQSQGEVRFLFPTSKAITSSLSIVYHTHVRLSKRISEEKFDQLANLIYYPIFDG